MNLAHITINTARLEESIAFYQSVLGLEINRDLRDEAGMPIVFLSGGTVNIELIENAEQAYHGGGISLGFPVDDVEAEHIRMLKQGLDPSPIVSPNPATKFFFIADPNGVSIQLL